MHGANVLGLYGWSGRRGRLERHTAFGAWPGLALANLGIHRTDVGSLLGFIWLRGVHSRMPVRMALAGRLQELVRIFLELRQTVVAAKKISLPVVDVASRGVVGSTSMPQIGSIILRNFNSPTLQLSRYSRLSGDPLLRYTGNPVG